MKNNLRALLAFSVILLCGQKLNAQCQAGFTIADTNGTYYFTDTSSAPLDSIVSWSWDFADGNTSALQDPTNIFPGCGWYVVTLTVTTNLGCSSIATDTLLVPGQLSSSYFFTTDSLSGNVQFAASPVNPNYIFNWDFGNGNTGTGINTSSNFTNGTYTVCLVTTDTSNACSNDTNCAAVTVLFPMNTCSAQFNFSQLSGTLNFSDLSTAPGDTIISWSWSFGDSTVSSQQNPSHTYSDCGSYSVSLTISTTYSCSSTFTDTVFVSWPINGSYTYLVDTTNGIAQFSAMPNNGTYSYSWDFGDGNPGTGSSTSNTYANGTYTACVVISDTTGNCMNDTVCNSLTINITPLPPCSANFSYTQTADTLYFQDLSAAPGDSIVSWSWNFGDGDSSTVQNPSHVFPSCGWYLVSLTISTADSCSSTSTDTVMASGTVNGGFSYTVDTLTGDATFSASPVDPNYSYNWGFSDGSNGVGQIITRNFAAGTYTACVIVADNSGACAADTFCNNFTVTTGNVPCQAAFTFSNSGNIYSFTNTSTAPGDSITNFSWSFGDFSSSLLENPTHTYNSCGSYTVTLSIVTSNSCTSVYSDTILVIGQLNGAYTFAVDTTTGVVQFAASPVSGTYSYDWDFGDGNTGTGDNISHSYAPGTYTACVIITDNTFSCMADTVCDSFTVIISPPTCNSTFTNTYLGGDLMNFIVAPFNFGWNYDWDFGDGAFGNGLVVNHTYPGPGTYTVCLTTTDPNTNCSSIFCDTVIVPVTAPCSIDFTWSATNGAFDFATTITGGPGLVVWSFGDGGTGIGANPSHQYTQNGFMIVCAILNTFTCSDTICHLVIVTGVGIEENSFAQNLTLSPNPVSEQLNISFDLEKETNLSVDVYDLPGNKVATVYTGKSAAGSQLLTWKNEVAPGIYFVRIQVGEKTITRKIIRQ
jgi:PKD repeat protein